MLASRGNHLQNPGDAVFRVTTPMTKNARDQLRDMAGYKKLK
jgi:hypothetical protein